MNNDLATLIYFIQVDNNGFVKTYTQDKHYNDPNYHEVVIDAAYLDDFGKHYFNYKYDTKLRTLFYPDESYIGPNGSQGSAGGGISDDQLNDIISQNQNYTNSAKSDANNYTNKARAKAVSTANAYTDNQVNNLDIGATKSYANSEATDAQNNAISATKGYANWADSQVKSQANSYTDSKVAGIHVSGGGVNNAYVDKKVSDVSTKAHDYAKHKVKELRDSLPTEFNNLLNITNISPVTKSTQSWGEPFTLHVEKGKTYFISAHVDSLNNSNGKGGISASKISKAQAYIITYDEDPMDSFAGINGVYVGKFTAPFTGNLPFGFTFINGASKGTFSNICITQSDYYVPFNMAESNKNKGITDDQLNTAISNAKSDLQNKINQIQTSSGGITNDQLNNVVNDVKNKLNNKISELQNNVNQDYVKTSDYNNAINMFNSNMKAFASDIDSAASNTLNQANAYTNKTVANSANSAVNQANAYTDKKIVEASNKDDAINKSKQSPNTVFTWRVG